jgi:arsenate reductase (thioredoxin)
MSECQAGTPVLFLCRDNAILSPMAEALLNHWGRGRFRALSAGWEPAAGVHELTARVLRRAQLLPAVLKPRGWSELAGEEGPGFRILVVLGHVMPERDVFGVKGNPLLAHWQIHDPLAQTGAADAKERAFERALREIEARVKLFASLPIDSIDRLAAARRLAEIEAAAGVQ